MEFRVFCALLIISNSVKIIFSATCDFDSKFGTDSKWKFCRCAKTSPISVAILCRYQQWPMIPELPAPVAGPVSPANGLFQIDNQRLLDATGYFYIDALNIVDGNLVYIHEEAFKNQPHLHKLDFSRNKIEKINANAFKGLEMKLTHLILNANLLNAFPQKSTSFLQQLQYLNLMHNAIDKLDESVFQYFKDSRLSNLKFLHLDHNLIDELPEGTFSPLNLKLLTLSNNRIRKNNFLDLIPFEALRYSTSTLETLDFEGNNLTEFHSEPDIKFHKNLTLNLAHNRISILDLDSLTSFPYLKKLILAHNQLSFVRDLSFRQIRFLEILDISNNKLSHLSAITFSTIFSSLKELYLHDNNLHILPPCLKLLTNLEILNLKSNKLLNAEESNFENFKFSLKELHISFNLLTKVPDEILRGNSNLKHLDLSKNEIRLLSEFDAEKLLNLNLAGNNLKFLRDKRVFASAPNLAYMDLSYNRIQDLAEDIFEFSTNLESLFLQHNKLEIFPVAAFRHLSKLRHLIMDNNFIIALPVEAFNSMKNLEHLSLKNNRIHAILAETFPPRSLKSLKSVKLSFNSISFLAPKTFADLPTLKSIELQANDLESLATYSFSNLSNLIKLDLSMNKINRTFQLTFFDLPKLQYLSLSSNFLNKIESGTFSDVSNLEILDLSRNHFIKFESQYLYGLKRLKKLNLAGNYITNVELNDFKSHLIDLDLSSNLLQQVDEKTFAEFYQLVKLNLAENSLMDVHNKAFLSDHRLSDVNLSRNELTFVRKMTFSGQKMLNNLDLSGNFLRKIDPIAFGQDNLHNLYLNSNKFQHVPQQALELVKGSLCSLDLSDNQIPFLESKYFDGLKNLTVLKLSSNIIQRIEEASFKGLSNLKVLCLDHNPVTDWHPNAFKDISSHIELVNLASTGIASLPVLGHRSIKYLNLSHNTLYDLDEHSMLQFPKLESLDVSVNRLSALRQSIFDALPYLKILNVSRNPVSTIDPSCFRNLHKLEVLDMHDLANLIRFDYRSFSVLRSLKELFFYGYPELEDEYNITVLLNDLPPLQVLHMEIRDHSLRNQLSNVDTRFLRYLHIGGNQYLAKVESDAFENLRGYSMLISVKNTGLKYFEKKTLQNLNHVSNLELDLSRNRLKTIELFDFYPPPLLNSRGTILIDIWLDGNMLICDCRLSWIAKWLDYVDKNSISEEARNRRIRRWNKTLCAAPENFYNLPVTRVDFETLGCSASDRCTTLIAHGIKDLAFLVWEVCQYLFRSTIKLLHAQADPSQDPSFILAFSGGTERDGMQSTQRSPAKGKFLFHSVVLERFLVDI
uniref:LRRCT domain-containing protein n=1 Tax=Romanomermis culicivorax TaxID=13658 RepID=A0A915KF17_ROMCU